MRTMGARIERITHWFAAQVYIVHQNSESSLMLFNCCTISSWRTRRNYFGVRRRELRRYDHLLLWRPRQRHLPWSIVRKTLHSLPFKLNFRSHNGRQKTKLINTSVYVGTYFRIVVLSRPNKTNYERFISVGILKKILICVTII